MIYAVATVVSNLSCLISIFAISKQITCNLLATNLQLDTEMDFGIK